MKRTRIYSGIIALMATFMVLAVLTPAHALEAKLSGQVSQLAMWADDGDEDDFFVGDNDNSSTRFRFTGEEAFGAVKAGFQIELEAQKYASNKMSMAEGVDDSDESFNVDDRIMNVYFDTQVGKFEIGQGDGAANGTSEVDLSGTSVITYSDVTATAGAFQWKDSDGELFGGTIGATRNNLDGLSRNQRLRYNTPTFGGFYAAGSVTNDEGWELAGWYSAEIYGKLAAGIGYVDSGDRYIEDDADFTQLAGSVSWLLPMGLNFTAALGERDYEDDDLEDGMNYYLKVGYKWSIHAVSVEYGMTEDLMVENLESSHYGAAYVINPWKPVEFFAAYRNYMADLDGDEPEDIQQIMAGTRIKF
ncbi:MAG: hypothetical protein WAU91_13080 [Desulfatitalea sp.]